MTTVKYRSFEPRLNPRRIRAQVPGWAGERAPRKDGEQEYPAHCLPFIEGAQSGIEVFYPYDNELHISQRDGKFHLAGEAGPAPGPGLQWPPFRNFGDKYYTYQLLLDLKVPDHLAIRAEPHPRYYTSDTDDVPLAVPAHLRTSWWPMISFVVFKTPPPGQTHIFRAGEPFMQFSIVPADAAFELAPMDEAEAAERELQSRRIHASRDTLSAGTKWRSATNTIFDGTYRHILGAARARDKTQEE